MTVTFWSSVALTGNKTEIVDAMRPPEFWSSVALTGNKTAARL